MNVRIKNEVLKDLKKALEDSSKSAVRYDLTGFGWSGPVFEIALDEQKDNDDIVEMDGVKFVVEKEFSELINDSMEIIKMRDRFAILVRRGHHCESC